MLACGFQEGPQWPYPHAVVRVGLLHRPGALTLVDERVQLLSSAVVGHRALHQAQVGAVHRRVYPAEEDVPVLVELGEDGLDRRETGRERNTGESLAELDVPGVSDISGKSLDAAVGHLDANGHHR